MRHARPKCDRPPLWGRGARRDRGAVCVLFAAALTLLSTAPAPALEIQCIEPSRYKHLLAVFNDDPNLFFSYFGLPRGRLPDMASCRALHVSGTLAAGDADALLERVIQGKGWLSVLYLSFEGSNLEEEARIATMVRAFSLKTRAVRSSVYNYTPDFTIRWDPPQPLTATSAATPTPREDISPLYHGAKAFLDRRDLRLKLEPDRSHCNDGCRTVWFAGVNRLFNRPADDAKPPAPPDADVNRRRVFLTYHIDWNRPPSAPDALSKPLEWASAAPPATARMLRDTCNPEFAVAETLEGRWGDAFDNAVRGNLKPRDIAALSAPFEALSRGGARLQQCLAAAYEAERLAAFQRRCTPACDKAALERRVCGDRAGHFGEGREALGVTASASSTAAR